MRTTKEILIGIADGSRNIEELKSDLVPVQHRTEFFHENNDGTYTCDLTGKVFTKTEFEHRHDGQEGVFRTVIFCDYSQPKE
jgi:hypothetical protein